LCFVEENLKSTASNDATQLIETVASSDKPTTDTSTLPVDNDLTSSAVKSRKRKAILLPDDYHSKLAVRKLDNGMFEIIL